MNIQDIKPAEGARTATKRIGRGIGSGMGKTSTRGHKGQWARSGGGVRPNFEGGQMPMTRRLPKIGFNNKRFAHVYNEVNVDVSIDLKTEQLSVLMNLLQAELSRKSSLTDSKSSPAANLKRSLQ